MPKKICYTMIVKNEAAVIRRCLESVLPHIDCWLICDTGSTDGTQDIIRETMKDIPGHVVNVPWVNFGENRSQAMDLARTNFPESDYILMLDADYCLNVQPDFDWDALTADAYNIHHEGDLDFSQCLLFSTAKPWRWTGVVHEHAYCEEVALIDRARGLSIVNYDDGSNQRDDLTPLMAEYRKDPENPRTVFYIAQSYMGLRQFEEALFWYEKRAAMEGFEEETWYALMQRARLFQQLDRDPKDVREAYMQAYFFRTHRFEPLCWLAQYCRLQSDYEAAFTFSSLAGTDLRYPPFDHLFIYRPVYDYLMLFEFGMSAAMTGRIRLANAAALRLLETNAPDENKAALCSAIEWAKSQKVNA